MSSGGKKLTCGISGTVDVQLDPQAEAKQKAEAERKRQLKRIEALNMAQYFILAYKHARRCNEPLPKVEFRVNGALLARIQIEVYEDDSDEEESGSATHANESYHLALLLYADQHTLSQGDFNTDDSGDVDIDIDAFPPCTLSQNMTEILEDDDAATGLCFAQVLDVVDISAFAALAQTVEECFENLKSAAMGSECFAALDQTSPEFVCYFATRQQLSMAFDAREKNSTPNMDQSTAAADANNKKPQNEEIAKLEAEILQTDDESPLLTSAEQAVRKEQLRAEAHLQATIFQYNAECHTMCAVRYYRNLCGNVPKQASNAASGVKKISIAGSHHCAFSLPSDDLQKKIPVGMYLIRMLYAMCANRSGRQLD